jgi:hypothetical protein
LAISGDPVTRPPTSSVRRRRFSSIGDEPITIGRIFAAASAHDDASVAEQPAFPWALCEGLNGSFFAGGICASKDGREAKTQRSKQLRKMVRRGIRGLSFPGISAQSFTFQLRSALYRRKVPTGALPAKFSLTFPYPLVQLTL